MNGKRTARRYLNKKLKRLKKYSITGLVAKRI